MSLPQLYPLTCLFSHLRTTPRTPPTIMPHAHIHQPAPSTSPPWLWQNHTGWSPCRLSGLQGFIFTLTKFVLKILWLLVQWYSLCSYQKSPLVCMFQYQPSLFTAPLSSPIGPFYCLATKKNNIPIAPDSSPVSILHSSDPSWKNFVTFWI